MLDQAGVLAGQSRDFPCIDRSIDGVGRLRLSSRTWIFRPRLLGLRPFPHLGLIQTLAAQHRALLAVRGSKVFLKDPVAVLGGEGPSGRLGCRVYRPAAIGRVGTVHGSGNSSLALANS